MESTAVAVNNSSSNKKFYQRLCITFMCLALGVIVCSQVWIEQKPFYEIWWIGIVSVFHGGIIGALTLFLGVSITIGFAWYWWTFAGIPLLICSVLGIGGAGILINIVQNPDHFNYNWPGILVTMVVSYIISQLINQKLR